MRRVSRGLFLASTALASAVQAQPAKEFAAAARRGTERYRVLAQAIADGYRAFGPESPSMGQHWVHTRRLLRDTLDPENPAILNYAHVAGRPVLVGVAYALPLGPGEPDPPPPAPGALWHSHARSLAVEAHLIRHRDHPADRSPERVAVLHAWVWAGNPQGIFEPDNWSLPYLRLGLPVPDSLDIDAARALALATGDSVFFATQLSMLAGGPTDSSVIAGQVRTAGKTMAGWWSGRNSGALRGEEKRLLANSWVGLLRTIEASVTAGTRARLREAFSF